jgi:hypothetical protein
LETATIIYDFACAADDYMLNRNPLLFKGTRPFIDKFHAKGHKCQKVFHLQEHPSLKQTNTSSSESFNRFVQQFRSQLAYMRQPIATKFLTVIIGVRNMIQDDRTRKKLDCLQKV